MRIAVVSNTAWYLCNFRLNLMLALKDAGHEVVAIAPHDSHADRLRAAGITFEPVAISGAGTHPVKELGSVMQLRRAFRKHGVELVLSNTPKGNLYSALACLSCGVPFVPNVSGLGRVFIQRSAATLIAKAIYRLTFRHAKHVFFQNHDDLTVFVDAGIVRREQCERIPGSGVDLIRFEPAPLPVRATTAPVFLLVARLMWDKGVREYIEAARELHATYPQAAFRILGFLDVANPSAIPRVQVESWVREGIIEYLGPTDDVRPFVADADCVVLPSYREGVPRTLLEAAAMARPVIATDAPGCRDTVLDGESGFLCRVADAADLARTFREFIALPLAQRHTMGLRGRQFVEDRFSERFVIDRYLATVQAIGNAQFPTRKAARSDV